MSVETNTLRAQRTSLMLMAHLCRHDRNAPSQHRVLNLSETGLRLSGARELRVDSVVSLSIGLIEHMPADVVWVAGDSAGLRFHEPIDLERARHKRIGSIPPPGAGWLDKMQNAYRR